MPGRWSGRATGRAATSTRGWAAVMVTSASSRIRAVCRYAWIAERGPAGRGGSAAAVGTGSAGFLQRPGGAEDFDLATGLAERSQVRSDRITADHGAGGRALAFAADAVAGLRGGLCLAGHGCSCQVEGEESDQASAWRR
ncbi:hypothetical protein G6F50_014750 [Rhizopus delemar]|uniref:Uncharacterized protein n=1 Tax=Rhizopus delemar TaxID=936053 RepID=A0A9P6Y2K9_9FUNG|nr:hypothetical protein G6F50_014750 [Rhizopus delemar]